MSGSSCGVHQSQTPSRATSETCLGRHAGIVRAYSQSVRHERGVTLKSMARPRWLRKLRQPSLADVAQRVLPFDAARGDFFLPCQTPRRQSLRYAPRSLARSPLWVLADRCGYAERRHGRALSDANASAGSSTLPDTALASYDSDKQDGFALMHRCRDLDRSNHH
ncbi:hypothetical protein L1887_59878 [Cichorium endivia]|nr:hypothetical protein L1887_59878 [Cichorium endivia]